MRHRIRAKDFILKVNLELLVFPSGARLTAAPCNSYFTDSERRRVTTLRWLIRSDETHRNWHLRRRRRKGTAHPRPPRPLCPLAGQDERTLEDWTLWTTRTAARGGGRDLVERSWRRHSPSSREGGICDSFFPLSLNCSPSAGT